MASFVDEGLAQQALDLAKVLIKAAMRRQIAKRGHGFAVIGLQDNGEFVELARMTFGDQNRWEHPYDAIALGKALISARTRLPSRAVQHQYPWLLESGDTLFGGSALDETHTLVAAFSGVQDYIDQMFAEVMVDCLKGLCHSAVDDRRKMLGDAANFYDDLDS